MPKSDAYQRLLREAFKELSLQDMLNHVAWEIAHIAICTRKVSVDSKEPKTP